MAAYAFMDGQGKRIASGVWSALGSKRAIKVSWKAGTAISTYKDSLMSPSTMPPPPAPLIPSPPAAMPPRDMRCQGAMRGLRQFGMKSDVD